MSEAKQFLLDRTATPTGTLLIVSDEEGRLRAIHWENHRERMEKSLNRFYREGFRLTEAKDAGGLTSALNQYLAGNMGAIENLRVETRGSAFQETVWKALREIPAGQTISYGELARRIGNPLAVRAVGLANGANPVSIVTPCHRVIGYNSKLTGYGGGLDRKRWLLGHEAAHTGLLAHSSAALA